MPARREYLRDVPLRVPPVVRRRAERALELGLIDPSKYVQAALSLEPIIDVLRDEDSAMRIAMIALLTERGDLEAGMLLTQMTQDPDDFVRTHAAQGLERLDARYRTRIFEAESLVAQRPDAETWADVATAYMAMAHLKRGAPVLRDFHLQRASAALEQALQRESRVEWLVLQAELQALGRQTTDAEATARRVLERQPLQPRALLLLAQLAFEQGLFDHVRQYCRRLVGVPELPVDVMDVVAFWTGEGEPRPETV